VLEDKTRFYYITCWTLASRKTSNLPVLEKAAKSFKRNEAGSVTEAVVK
jgi:hypothetical protein